MKIIKYVLLTFFLFPHLNFAKAQVPSRVSKLAQDIAKPMKVTMSWGRATVIEFPKEIVEVRVGDPKSVKVLLSEKSARELTVFISEGAISTNLIVKSGTKLHVIDIVPSPTTHQDVVLISGSFGGPNQQMKLVEYQKIAPRGSK